MFWAVFPNGFCYCFDEIYVTGETYDGISDLIREKVLRWNLRFEHIIADPAIFGDKQHHRFSIAGETGGEYLQSRLMIPVIAGDNRRVIGWNRMRVFLESETIAWHPRCKNCIRTIPTLVHDDIRPEDVDSDGDDHCGDAARYFCMARPVPKAKTITEPEILVGSNPDYNIKLVYNQRTVKEVIKKQLTEFEKRFNNRNRSYNIGTGRW